MASKVIDFDDLYEECDCGELKLLLDEACANCSFLDQEGSFSGAVVSALRVLGGQATLIAIEEETGLSYRQVQRACAALLLIRRIAKYIDTNGEDGGIEAIWILNVK